MRGAISSKSLRSRSRSAIQRPARRRAWSVPRLPWVMTRSAIGRSSLALGSVVTMCSAATSEESWLRNSASRCEEVRPSLRWLLWCGIASLPGPGSGRERRMIRHVHAEAQAEPRQQLLQLLERLAAEVLGLEHLALAAPHQIAQGVDVGVLQAVRRAHREIELVDALGEQRVEAGQLLIVARAGAVTQALLGLDEDPEVVLEQHRGQRDRFLGAHRAVGPHLEHQALVVGGAPEAGRLH